MRYDVVIIGGGPGGYVAAIKCAQGGKKVLLIEKRETLGGVCLNEGCVPTKAILKSIKLLKAINKASQMGVIIKGQVNADPAGIVSRSSKVVNQLTSGLKVLMEKNNVDVVHGNAELVAKNKVKLNGDVIEADDVVVATGTIAKDLDLDGASLPHVMGSREALTLQTIPSHLAVIGGGAIGIEFASIYKGLGVDVSLIEMMPTIMPGSDTEMATYLLEILKSDGISFYLGSKISQITSNEIHFIDANGNNKSIGCDSVLASIGRKPNTSFLVSEIDILNEKGAVETNKHLQTKVKGLWAIGDVNGKYNYAHVASAEGAIAAANICGGSLEIDYSIIPNVVYTDPEFAWTGFTEEEVIDKGLEYDKALYPLSSNSRALCEGADQGLIKVLAGKKYREILGVHIIGPHAGELISEAMLAIRYEITADDLVSVIHAHPSLSEIYAEASYQIIGKPLHG